MKTLVWKIKFSCAMYGNATSDNRRATTSKKPTR
jgi:hypothetical protein